MSELEGQEEDIGIDMVDRAMVCELKSFQEGSMSQLFERERLNIWERFGRSG